MMRFATGTPSAITWRGNICLGIAQILIWGGSLFLLAVLAEPIHRDTGWSLTWIYGALTAGVLVSALLSPRAGVLIARGWGRAVLIASGCAVGLGMGIIGASNDLAVFLLGWCVIGAGMAGGLYDPLFATLGRHHGKAARSSINAVTLIAGFASTITWPVQAWMVDAWGWRPTCWIYGGVLAVVIAPLYRAAMPSGPMAIDDQASVDTAKLQNKGVEYLAPLTYLLLSLVFSIAAILMTAVSVQIILLLRSSGHSAAAAIALGTLIGPSMVVVRLLSLPLRQLHPVSMALFSASCVALGLAMVSAAPMAAAAGIACYGVGNGLRAVVRGTLPLCLVPPAALPLVMGRLARSSLFCQALTPLACGFLFTHLGAKGTLWSLAALATLNVVFTFMLYRLIDRTRAGAASAG